MSTNESKDGDERLRKPAAGASRGSRDSADAERTEQMGLSMTSAERQKPLDYAGSRVGAYGYNGYKGYERY